MYQLSSNENTAFTVAEKLPWFSSQTIQAPKSNKEKRKAQNAEIHLKK